MSYKDNIYTAYVELTRIYCSGIQWPLRPKAVKDARLVRLYKYLRRAVSKELDLTTCPLEVRGGPSRLGKRAKQEAARNNAYLPGKPRPKVHRRTCPARMFRYRISTLMTMCAIPDLPEGGLASDDFDHFIWVRNNRVGEVIFVKADGSSVTVPYIEDKDKTEPEVSAAWDKLTRLGPNGTQIPLIPARRRIPVTE
jgi:hypothetical protein